MKRILVIEDNEPDLMMLQFALTEAGVAVVLDVVEDGSMARERLKPDCQPAELPHLVLVDMNVPKGDGLLLLEHIRRCGWLREVPVVVWSSTRVPKDLEAVRAFQVADFLIKPADLEGWSQMARQLATLLV